jgi:hypothetical protein
MGGRRTLILLALCATACRPAPETVSVEISSDAASRLVAEVRDGAARLKSSPSDTLVLSVASHASAGGCPDGYRVEWRADSDRIPGLGVVCTTGTRGFASISYRGIVNVPRPLQVTKRNGEPLTVALHKRTDGVIEVTALQ